MVMITFSVGPSGVVWAVDKKETVRNRPMTQNAKMVKIG